MTLSGRIIEPIDLEEVWAFEAQKLRDQYTNEDERILAGWNSPARKEAMEYYFKTGWSFMVRDSESSSAYSNEGSLVGYFLGQPFLFFEAQTQVLWIEHLQYSSLKARDYLCEIAYRLAREKHFQRVLFPNNPALKNSLNSFKVENWEPSVLLVKTTR